MLLDALIAALSCFSNDLLLCSAVVSHAVLLVTVFFLQGQPLICFTAGPELRLVLGGSKRSEGRWLSGCVLQCMPCHWRGDFAPTLWSLCVDQAQSGGLIIPQYLGHESLRKLKII